MLKKIALFVVLVIAAILVIAMFQPSQFSVQRSTTINAAPEAIYPMIDDFHRWSVWSPWEKLDPAMKRTHSGAPSGKGAVYAWNGNRDVGSGRMEIIEAVPSSKAVIQLDFLEPFAAHNTAEFTLTPNGRATTVTWTMRGPSPFIGKVISLFVSMDKMVGGDFERGLANLKAAAERGHA